MMITIMTPTYNRAYILTDAYESLKKQTSYEFEWIIVDDGSTDNTEQIVNEWIKNESNFTISYIKQQNGGKHRAVNKGVALAKYDYFFILDSDDRLVNNAVSTIHKWIRDISGLNDFAGVAGLKQSDNFVIGGKQKKEYIDATNLERKKYGLLGDKAEVYKTEILKRYPFPAFEGENFLRESAVWDHIAKDGYKIRWFNEVIYLCNYITDGLTQNTNINTYANNFKGFTYCTKLFLETHSFFPSLNKCGEFYKVARINKISKKEVRALLNIKRWFLNAGIIYYNLRTFTKLILRPRTNKRK